MATPGMADEVERVSEEGGTAALIRYLDEHGLRWRAGGSDPATALTEMAAFGGFECDGFEPERPAVDRAVERRRAARKAARKARRTHRR